MTDELKSLLVGVVALTAVALLAWAWYTWPAVFGTALFVLLALCAAWYVGAALRGRD